MEKLKKGKAITVNPPDGLKWNLWSSVTHPSRLEVYYITPSLARISLNPGWELANGVFGIEEAARVILGQIFAGRRDSGHRLEDLDCDLTMSDGEDRIGNFI